MSERDSFPDETGSGSGAARENDPRAAGFTFDTERLFRSHFQRANHLADVAYESARPAYQLGYTAASDPCYDGKCFEEVESDLQSGWLSVRTAVGDWASVRPLAKEAFRLGREHGRMRDMTPSDGKEQSSYSDPLADDTTL